MSSSSRAWARRIATVLIAGCALGGALAAAPPPSKPGASTTLPPVPGWTITQRDVLKKPGWGLPQAQSGIMNEYGLLSLERETARRGARTLQITAMRFRDADGAYGAYTTLRPAGAHAFALGQPQSWTAADGSSFLFTRGVWLMRVSATGVTTGELRRWAVALSPIAGFGGTTALPENLPGPGLQADSVRFVEGPLGLAAACGWLHAQTLGFDQDADAIVARYATASGGAQLVIVNYPTNEMAGAHLNALKGQPGIVARRDGPLLVLVHSEGASPAALDALAAAVHFNAVLTTVPYVPVGIVGELPALIIGIFMLCALIMGVAIVLGVLTGSLRVLAHRLWPERFARAEEDRLIRLRLG